MKKAINTAMAVTLAAGGAIAVMASAMAPANAQQQGQLPRGWFKVCAKQEENDICNVQNIVTAETGQLITGISMIEVKGKINRKVFQVTVPSGRVIPPGIGLQVDDVKPQQLPYAICFQDRCIAEAPLTDDLVGSFKRGGELTLTSINFQNKPNPVKISLNGFTAAYDGEGLKQSEIEERQKQLAEEIEKRKKEFEDKLKAEQEKAKDAGN